MPLQQGLLWLATGACGLFAGGALYASLVEHPGRLACGPPMALAQFRMSYPRGAALQAPLALGGGLAAAAAWLAGAPIGWLVAGVALALVVPYTFVSIMPVNRRLLDPGLPPDAPEVHRLLRRWGWLHLVRTALAVMAFALMLRLLVGR